MIDDTIMNATNITGQVYQRRELIEPTHPHAFNWIMFTVVLLVVWFFSFRKAYRIGFFNGRHQERVDRYNNGA